MTIEVIGAGTGRTGTLSLKVALEQLGFGKCYHMVELLGHPEQVTYWEALDRGEPIDWDALFDGYRATVDYPGYLHYRALMERYPEAKVILTTRDPERWYRSARETIYRAGPGPLGKVLMSFRLPFSRRLRRLIRIFRLAERQVWKEAFGGRFEDKDHAIAQFPRHNDEVVQTVPADRLLVFEVKQGWEPLCAFLGVPVPDEPFPHLNDRATFQANAKRLMKGSPLDDPALRG